MNIAALLTGRGNNTLKDKNILPVLGKPLLYYPAKAAADSSHITRYFASSDDPNILAEAEKVGYTGIARPPELALPTSQHVGAIVHALKCMDEHHDLQPDILVVLLANNGIVKTSWINGCIEQILDDPTISAVVPVNVESDHHPVRAKKMNQDGFLEPFFDLGSTQVSTNRQDLEPCFFLGHNFWVLNVARSVYAEDGQLPWSFMGNRIKPYPVEKVFDVHAREDLALTERWIKDNYEY